MADSVKFIFKTLIKVPIIIFVAFFILNILSFFLIYFKMLGLSYVVMQTAVENNFIPTQERNTICQYLYNTSNDIRMVKETGLIIGKYYEDTVGTVIDNNRVKRTANGMAYVVCNNNYMSNLSSASSAGALRKRQYGKSTTCGVYCEYVIIWPLDTRYTGGSAGDINARMDEAVNGTGSNTYRYNDVAGYDGVATTNKQSYLSSWARIPITITYTVPGLKYYPDLAF